MRVLLVTSCLLTLSQACQVNNNIYKSLGILLKQSSFRNNNGISDISHDISESQTIDYDKLYKDDNTAMKVVEGDIIVEVERMLELLLTETGEREYHEELKCRMRKSL